MSNARAVGLSPNPEWEEIESEEYHEEPDRIRAMLKIRNDIVVRQVGRHVVVDVFVVLSRIHSIFSA
jgi:hypothetical protein